MEILNAKERSEKERRIKKFEKLKTPVCTSASIEPHPINEQILSNQRGKNMAKQ